MKLDLDLDAIECFVGHAGLSSPRSHASTTKNGVDDPAGASLAAASSVGGLRAAG